MRTLSTTDNTPNKTYPLFPNGTPNDQISDFDLNLYQTGDKSDQIKVQPLNLSEKSAKIENKYDRFIPRRLGKCGDFSETEHVFNSKNEIFKRLD